MTDVDFKFKLGAEFKEPSRVSKRLRYIVSTNPNFENHCFQIIIRPIISSWQMAIMAGNITEDSWLLTV